MEDNIIPCKLPLCMICVSPISSKEEDPLLELENKTISKEVFLRGINILSNNLSLEDGCRFGREEEWTRELGTKENFVGSVCCGKCGEVVRSLVELQDLIRETEVKLKENVNLLELSVVKTVGLAKEVEYSIGTCLRFREEVMKGFQSRYPGLKVVERASKKKKIAKPEANALQVSKLQEEAIISEICVSQVKLDKSSGEYLNLSILPDQNNDAFEGLYRPPRDHELSFEENDEEFSSNDVNQTGQRGKRKLQSAPKLKHSNKGMVLRPRGGGRRPEMKLGEDDDELTMPAKRRRGQLSKGRLRRKREVKEETTPEGFDMPSTISSRDKDFKWTPEDVPESSSEENEDDSENENQMKPVNTYSRKRRRGRPKGSKSTMSSQFDDRKTSKKVGKLLNIGCPYYLKKSFLNIGRGMLSYLNCKILMEGNRLVCKHPDCFFESQFAYFTTFQAFRDMRFHVKIEHRKPKASEENSQSFYFCIYCNAQFEKRFLMMEHIKTDHSTALPFPSLCEVCGMSLPNAELLDHVFTHKSEDEKQYAIEMQTSVSTHRLKAKDPTLPMEFPCDKCDQVFDNHTRLRTHARTHVPIELRKQFQCDRCPEKLESLKGLGLHMKTVHLKNEQPKPYECHICGKKFMSPYKVKYEVHMRSHTGELPFQCAECGKGFREKYALKKHGEIHVDMQIPCEFCFQMYRNQRNLKRHQYKHHPDLVKLPDKMVTKKYTNLEHTDAYYGPKLMYPCEPCGKVYKYKSQLVPHLMRVHKIFQPKSYDYPNMFTMEDEGYHPGQ